MDVLAEREENWDVVPAANPYRLSLDKVVSHSIHHQIRQVLCTVTTPEPEQSAQSFVYFQVLRGCHFAVWREPREKPL